MAKQSANTKIVIMAGGQGTRFWPVSRASHPKQFLKLGDSGRSLIQLAADRVRSFSSEQDMLVVTNARHVELVREHLPAIQILAEPIGRNTAASIGLAALCIAKNDPSAVMIVLSADHAISKPDIFTDVLTEAVAHAQNSNDLVTLGITPDSAHTGYGYIRRGDKLSGRIHRVSSFVEKPNLEKAQQYLSSGEYSWNSGMFIGRADVFLAAVKEHMPKLWDLLELLKPHVGSAKFDQIMAQEFPKLDSVPVDIGILERAKNCAMVQAPPFGWSDVGSWDAWAEHFPKDSSGNVLQGDTIAIGSKDSIVLGDKRVVALIGVDNLIVIDSGDALLVCAKEKSQDVKKVVEALAAKKRNDLL